MLATMRYCQVLDLKDDPVLIAEYEMHHQAVWPEVLDHLRLAGVKDMTIWHYQNRLVMLLEASDDFSFERLAAMEASNPKVQEWEQLMWRFQCAISGPAGGKWKLSKELFRLSACDAIQ
ncbi:L-rhamnose mutarotase [Pseudomonas sp. Pseusp122]|uniref:L-rhamnose mutarotase n=1 Tax=unclassified Pseudomonas TaxID=196821 RepID=UPI0039A6CA21